jgi:hypothetical protein
MVTLFNDAAINRSLEESGYITLPLLDEDDLRRLKELYNRISGSAPGGNSKLFVSSRECDYETSLKISTEIKEILQPYFEKIAHSFTLYGGAFLAKPKHDTNEFSLHQDFTLVQPEQHQMFAIWIALQDTNRDNGAVFLLEKSHRLVKGYISATYNNTKIERKQIDPDFVKPVCLKAGEAIIFSDSIFHGSYSNLSDSERIAVTARITDKDAPFVYYHKSDEQTAEFTLSNPMTSYSILINSSPANCRLILNG